ncbi:MAG: ABC-2 family transporter protein [Candidatus Gracilibacteria bacterium]
MKLYAYPINAFINSLTRIAYALSGIGVIYFAYLVLPEGSTITGATFSDTLIAFLLFQTCFYFLGIFFYNSPELVLQIHRGQLDNKLIRPCSSVWNILLQEIYPTSARDMFYSAILLIGLTWYYNSFTILEWMALLGIFISSCIIMSSLNLMFSSCCFYFEGFLKGPNWFKDQASQICRYPKDIYPEVFQWIFFPIFFVATPVFSLLRHTYTFNDVLLQLFMTIATLLISLYIWNQGLRHYSSAN